MLSLTEVEQGHDGGLLVLGRISLKDLGHDGLVLLVELKRDIGVVIRGVAVLFHASSDLYMRGRSGIESSEDTQSTVTATGKTNWALSRALRFFKSFREWPLTTIRESLGRVAVMEKARAWGRATRQTGRKAQRMRGVSLLAIVMRIEGEEGSIGGEVRGCEVVREVPFLGLSKCRRRRESSSWSCLQNGHW